MPPLNVRRNTGFSLIELLVVIALLALVVGFAIPAVRSLLTARGVAEASAQLVAACDMARTAALGQRTFVWVGVQNTNLAGTEGLRIGVAASRDGTTNAAVANLQPLGRAVSIGNVRLSRYSELDASITGGWTGKSPITGDLHASTTGAEIRVGQSVFSDRKTLTFTPSGEVLLQGTPSETDGFEKTIGIGLSPANGREAAAAVVVDGATGKATILQPN